MNSIDLSGATLVFDLDGTLVDTAPDLLAALNHVLGRTGLDPRPPQHIRPFISLGARRMIIEGLRANGAVWPDSEIDGLLAEFLVYYEAHIAVESRPYAGVEAFLARAAGAGARLAVCTNKREGLSKRLLGELGLDRHFHAVAGRDTFPVCKPHPRHLTGAVEMAAGDLARAVMIGDSETDIATAKAARVPVVAVSFGYSETPVSAFSPDHVIDRYDDLQMALSSIFSKP